MSDLNWRELAEAAGLDCEGKTIRVAFKSGRSHKVKIIENEQGLLARAIAVNAANLNESGVIAEHLWRRNRSLQLVGLRIDDRGRLVAEAWLPTAGLTSEEFAVYVQAVAAEADRMEFWLTGEDVE